jgi:type III secretory pathway component EscV
MRTARNKIVADYGLMLPALEVEFHASIPAGMFHFCLYEVPHLQGSFEQEDLSEIANNLSTLLFQTASRFIGIQEAAALIGFVRQGASTFLADAIRLF